MLEMILITTALGVVMAAAIVTVFEIVAELERQRRLRE